jgi:hypothetical protein
LKAKVAVLLVLALFAFALHSTTAFSLLAPKIYGVSDGSTEYNDPPTQPCGDPIDDESHVPH